MLEKKKETIISIVSSDNKLLLWFQRWLDAQRYHCGHCNKEKNPNSFYYLKNSWVYPQGRLPICKKCMNEMYMYYFSKYNDAYKAMNKICQLFDIYFDVRLFKTVIEGDYVVGRYLQRLNLRQNRNKLSQGYDGSYLKFDIK